MSRRGTLSTLLALAALLAATGNQAQPRVPLIGVLVHGMEDGSRHRMEPLRDGLRALGYSEGKSCRIEVRYSDNQIDRLPALARELLALKPDVVVTSPVRAAQALHRETKTVPIVMASGAGAQNLGLIASLARPGGNVTGLTNQGDELTAKHFELLREIAPRARRVATLSSGLGSVEAEVRIDSRAAAKRYGIDLIEVLADSPARLPDLADRCRRYRCEGLVVLLDPNTFNYRKDLVALAATLRIPAIYPQLEYASDGGLVAYAVDGRQLWRRSATYVDRILKGTRPADLPVEQPTTFELVINVKTAQALGIKIPQTILSRTDRVIQ